MNKIYDLVIIGGGAGGLSAAITAERRGLSVAILEKEDKLGKKILVSGNGKCNLSASDVDVSRYNTTKIDNILNISVTDFFRSLNLATKETGGRIYPYSESALSVLNALRKNFHGDVFLNKAVNKIIEVDSIFDCGGICGRNVLLATGSNATKGTDSTSLYADFGHKVKAFVPSVVPLVTDVSGIKGLSGIRVKCAVTLLGETVRRTEKGELLFKDNGVSGIVSMTLSSFIARSGERCDLSLDLVPDLKTEQIEALTAKGGAESFLQKAVAQCVEKQAKERGISLPECMKNFIIKNARLGEMKNAQVACGGLILDEFDENLQSKRKKGLYACGEVLDVDGECGGYNLHFAFASGIKAGNSVC